MSHDGRRRVHADSATDSLRIKIKVTWLAVEKQKAAGMNEATSPPNIPPLCHNTPAACVTAPQPPRFHSGSLWMEKRARPPRRCKNCWANPTFVWPGWVQCDMASSRGPVWDLGQGSSSLCAQSHSSPRARVLDHPAMSPPLCSGLSAPHRHSHSVR